MNRISFFFFMAFMTVALATMANPINEAQARSIASNFLAQRVESPKLAFRASSGTAAAFYVFNTATANKGFVIVAGDDRIPPILGYSDSGSFDADDVPPAMQEWLDGYAAQIEAIEAGATPEVRTTSRNAIAPLLNVHWSQGLPYNVMLPHINGSENHHAYVGCVAIAMAQIMAYWQYPARPTKTIPGYVSNKGRTYEVTMPSLSPVDFDWGNMHDTYYINDSTSAAARAVQTLSLYCTTSLESSLGLTSTGSFTRYIPGRLINYFGYKNTAHYIYREDYSTTGWEDVLYAELYAGRPVAYGGNKQSGGHAFVCDGYDGEGRFHINWGWNGKSNGYFLLNLLNPGDEGIGSAAGAYGYVLGQGMAIGIEPDDGIAGEAALSFEDLSISASSSTRGSASSNFSVSVSGKFINNTNVTSQFRQGWGLYKDGELQEVLFIRYTTSALANGGYITVNARPLNFGADITSGTYRILPIYSIYPGEDYKPCIGSDVNYIEITFNGAYSCMIKGYGTAGSTTRYNVNSCTASGTLNHGKPVTLTLNLTNAGTSTNDMIYMFVDGSFTAMGLANIGAGENGDIVYRFTPTTAGNKTVTFSLNENGSSPFHTQRVTINSMPAASLDVSYRILNITDENNRIITADRYSIIADITNTGTTDYDEDFSVRLYRVNNENTNVGTELLNQTQPLQLAAGESTSLQFDFDHDLIDGWKYFCYLYYYSAGQTVSMGTKWYTLNLTNVPTTGYNVTTNVTPANAGTIHFTSGVIANKAQAGDTVSFIVTPNTGYTLGSVTVSTTGGESIETVLDSATGTYSFIMPEEGVTVSATFNPIPVYDITATANNCSGTYEISAVTASAGETVYVTASPNVGWQCDGITVMAGGNPVEVIYDGGYSFIMPDGDVDVNVIFSRSTGSLFKLINTRADITQGDTYVLVSRNHGKVMKRWSDGDATFQADDVTGWVDEGQSVVRVNDDSGFFTMTQMADTTISGNARTAAYLTNGNAYMRTSNYNVFMQDGIVAESRAWMYIGNADNCLIRFKDSTSGSNGNWIVRYDNENDQFKVMNWNVTGAEVSRVWLYKLVEAFSVNTNASEGGTIVLTSGIVNGAAQCGETVTFTVTTDMDYSLLDSVTVVTTTGENVEFSIDENGIYSFIMPEHDLTINATFGQTTPEFMRGDVNDDGLVSIIDVTALIDYLLSDDASSINLDAADCSQDGFVSIIDATRLIDYLLTGYW